jgi:rRNA maturation protein Nop10
MANKEPQDFSAVEQQIGGMGGEIETQSLGKLKYDPLNPNAPTGDEKKDMEQFLEKSRIARSEMREGAGNDIRDGWVPISRDSLGKRDQFYPSEWEFRVRPATVESIKNWSAVDDARIEQLNSVYNEILKSNVSIKKGNDTISWQNINSWDRFWFIMKVREYTFAKGEAKLEYTEDCSECGNPITFTMTPETLNFEYPDQEIVDKYWNSVDRCWIIDPTDFGVEDSQQIKLYIPTLGKEEQILNWVYGQAQSGKKIDEQFIKTLPWLLKNASKDRETLDSQISLVYRQYKNWSLDMFLFMQDVLKNIAVTPLQTMKTVCPACGEEVTTSVQFPGGIKSLFITESRYKKFGTK